MSEYSSSRSRNELLALAGLLTVIAALRFFRLGADPLPDLDWGFISDLGTWYKNPRLHALWGRWTIDDGNYGVLTGPSYAVAVRAMFAVFGVGRAQAYASNALSGVLSAYLIYTMVRRQNGATTALLAAAFTGINGLLLAYDRSSYPESFQVMAMVATVAAILASRERPLLAVAGGLSVIVVLLAKPPGLALAPVAAATWAAVWWVDRREGRGGQGAIRSAGIFTVAATMLLAAIVLVFLIPHAQDVWLHFQAQMRDGAVLGASATDRIPFFGTRLGYRMNLFFRREWYLVAIAGTFGVCRLANVLRRPVSTLELASWIWLVMGMGVMGLQTYQQDRRFLFLIPPLSILSALFLTQRVVLGASAWTSVRARRLGLGAGALVGSALVLFYVLPGVLGPIAAGFGKVGITVSRGGGGGIVLSAVSLIAGLVLAWRAPAVSWGGHVRLQMAVALVPLLLVGARAGLHLSRLEYGLEQVSQTIARIAYGWPMVDRVAVGWPATTLTMGTGVWPANHETKGLSAAERFRPQLELYAIASGRALTPSAYWQVPGRPAKVDCAQRPIWAGRYVVHIFVEPDRLAACRTAASAPVGASR